MLSYGTMKIQIKYAWAYLYAYCILFCCIVWIFIYSILSFSSFIFDGLFRLLADFWIDQWFSSGYTHSRTHILLIVNAHSNEIIPASLFAVINIKFLCSRVHLSHIILCRLSCCWILFVSGRLFLLCVAFSAWIFICIFHHIAFHVQMDFRLKIF